MKKSVVMFYLFLFLSASVAQAQTASDSEAKWLLERITGVRWPLQSPIVAQMSGLISQNRKAEAVQIAIAQPQFLNITVKQMALQASTREETLRLPLNDFAAMFIGVTRDGIDARELLTGDYYYAANPALIPAGVTIRSDLVNDILKSNNHYQDLQTNRVDVGAVLEKRDGQMISINDVANPSPNPAGLITSRTFMGAHAIAGTNRRLVEFSLRSFLCSPIEDIADTNAPDARIGRDIDRFPGGDHQKFQTTCKGCHTTMDGFRGAFAKWNFNNNVVEYDMGGIVGKMNQNNNVFPGGYTTTDASWVNHATIGANASKFGWRSPSSTGVGTKAFGELLANSKKFSSCMAKHVFDIVCKRELSTIDQQLIYTQLASKWETSGYRIKALFEMAALHPNCRFQFEGSIQ